MTTPWLQASDALPLMETRTDAPQKNLRDIAVERADYAALLQRHQGDFLLLSVVLIFLVGSYLTCRYCRCRWLYKRSSRSPAHADGGASDGHAYVTYTSNGTSQPTKKKFVLESVTSSQASVSTHPTMATNPKKNAKQKKKTVLVSEMEQPFLGPPDYEQPPAYELSPPAYDYLPSAPPLSDDTEHSPKLL